MRNGLFLVAAAGLVMSLSACGDSGSSDETDAARTTIEEPDDSGSGPFPAGEPVDVVYIADSSSVGVPYADLVAEILDREVRLDVEVEEDPDAIRTTYADRIAEAEIIVFYFNSIAFDEDMPGPTFDESCLEAVFALENPDESDSGVDAGDEVAAGPGSAYCGRLASVPGLAVGGLGIDLGGP